MIKVSTTGMAVSLKTDLRFPISGQWGHGDRIIHSSSFFLVSKSFSVWRTLSAEFLQRGNGKESGALRVLPFGMTENVPELEGFHFHTLRHTYTTNLLSNGAQPKDVQELLGHSDVSTTMNVYAHATREAKRTSARLLDKVAGND